MPLQQQLRTVSLRFPFLSPPPTGVCCLVCYPQTGTGTSPASTGTTTTTSRCQQAKPAKPLYNHLLPTFVLKSPWRMLKWWTMSVPSTCGNVCSRIREHLVMTSSTILPIRLVDIQKHRGHQGRYHLDHPGDDGVSVALCALESISLWIPEHFEAFVETVVLQDSVVVPPPCHVRVACHLMRGMKRVRRERLYRPTCLRY